jgi:hypothetical protein
MSAYQIIGNLVIAGVGAVLTMWILYIVLILNWKPKNPKHWPDAEWFRSVAPNAPRGAVVPYIVTPEGGIRFLVETAWMDDGLTPEWDWPVR